MNLSSGMAIYTLGDLLWADFWHRFPSLRFSLTEGDIGWIPYFLWRAEHTLERHNGWMQHELPQGLSPTELFHERILVCFINDRIGVKLLDEFDVGQVCWESDYPHSDSSWPERARRSCGSSSPTSTRATRRPQSPISTRCAHYQFDPFSVRPTRALHGVARCGPRPTDVDTVTHVGRLADESDRNAWRRITGAAAAAAAASK